MIGYFPEPYPDEDLGSILARLAKIMGYPNARIFRQEVGCAYGRVHLKHLTDLLPPGHCCTEDRLLTEHSMYPYWTRVASFSLYHYRVQVYGRYKFCRICVTSDRAAYGEAYWHRQHQCSGVLVCHNHGIPLSQMLARQTNMLTAEEALSTCEYINYDLPTCWHDIAQTLAADCAWMFTPDVQHAPRAFLAPFYRTLLFDLGLMSLGRHIAVFQFEKLFYDCWPKDFVELVRISMREYKLIDRVVTTIRGDRPQEPIIHLLLCRWLGYTPEALFVAVSKYQPFGPGPWPCLNPFCRYFLKPVIKDVEVASQDQVSEGLWGTFRCTCGFAYYRLGPDLHKADAFTMNGCEERGRVWERKYKQWWQHGKIRYPDGISKAAFNDAVQNIWRGGGLYLLSPDTPLNWECHYRL